MINTDELRAEMARKRISGRKLAPKLNMTDTTFYAKMKKGIFGSDEIEGMITELGMNREKAIEIFFAD